MFIPSIPFYSFFNHTKKKQCIRLDHPFNFRWTPRAIYSKPAGSISPLHAPAPVQAVVLASLIFGIGCQSLSCRRRPWTTFTFFALGMFTMDTQVATQVASRFSHSSKAVVVGVIFSYGSSSASDSTGDSDDRLLSCLSSCSRSLSSTPLSALPALPILRAAHPVLGVTEAV